MGHFEKALCMKHQETAVPINRYCCSDCNETISYDEYKYSLRNFDKPFCKDCQPEEEETVSAAPKKFQGTYKIEVCEKPPDKKNQT
jgi:hypothetical protein